mgnify:CR=1 FL=1
MRVIQKRDILLWIILSVITCGICNLIWLYNITEDMNAICGDEYNTSGGLVVLLALVGCYIYLIYWGYKMGQRIDRWHNSPNSSHAILYLILNIFGLNIVTMALIQDELNIRVDENTTAA